MASTATFTGSLSGRTPLNTGGIWTGTRYLIFIEFVKEVIPLIVGDDECRHVLDPDFPDSLHAEIFEIDHLNRFDIFCRKYCCRTSDRTEIKPSVLFACIYDSPAPVSFGNHD